MEKRFNIEYDEIAKIISLDDKQESVVIVMTMDQIEGLFTWYCDKFNKIVI